MEELRKYLLFIILAIQMIDLSSGSNDTDPDIIVVIEDARHISNETIVIGYNETK